MARMLEVAEEMLNGWEAAKLEPIPLRKELMLRLFVVARVNTESYPVDWLDEIDEVRKHHKQRHRIVRSAVSVEHSGDSWVPHWGLFGAPQAMA